MRDILATPIGTVLDIDTLPLFRKRPKGVNTNIGFLSEGVLTAQTVQPE